MESSAPRRRARPQRFFTLLENHHPIPATTSPGKPKKTRLKTYAISKSVAIIL